MTYENWRGSGFIRIHRDDCRYAKARRVIDSNAPSTMWLDGVFATLEAALHDARSKANPGRWKPCTHCCPSVPDASR